MCGGPLKTLLLQAEDIPDLVYGVQYRSMLVVVLARHNKHGQKYETENREQKAKKGTGNKRLMWIVNEVDS